MIQKHSDDPNVEIAAKHAFDIVQEVLAGLPKAETFDYGGHDLRIGEYEVCPVCTSSIAEAQQAEKALLNKADEVEDAVVKEHLQLAARLFRLEAEAAIVRAEFHNGIGTEKILNALLGFRYERNIQEEYNHSHHRGA